MAFKMKGFSAFEKTDPPKKEEVKTFIENNMDKMSDKELMAKVAEMSAGEFSWNPNTGEVKAGKNPAKFLGASAAEAGSEFVTEVVENK